MERSWWGNEEHRAPILFELIAFHEFASRLYGTAKRIIYILLLIKFGRRQFNERDKSGIFFVLKLTVPACALSFG